jgi:hypothetical protein
VEGRKGAAPAIDGFGHWWFLLCLFPVSEMFLIQQLRREPVVHARRSIVRRSLAGSSERVQSKTLK